jgi:hypothetical protein
VIVARTKAQKWTSPLNSFAKEMQPASARNNVCSDRHLKTERNARMPEPAVTPSPASVLWTFPDSSWLTFLGAVATTATFR